jgi:putative transposase
MSNKKPTYSPDFKTRVVLALLSGEKSLAQIASKYKVTAASLKSWKKQFLENASLAFDLGKATKVYKDEVADLKHENDALAKKLCKTTIERDWAVGKLKSLESSTKKGLVDSKLSCSLISITRQCDIMGLNRSTLYHKPKPVSQTDLKIMTRIDDMYTNISLIYGYRFMHQQL